MNSLLVCVALCMPFNGPSISQNPPAPDPIHWPVTPNPPPPPPPSPTDILTMTVDQICVVGIDEDAVVLASPGNLVNVSSNPGPIKIRGSFVGGNGIETKTFTNKQVVTIEPVANGRVEILVVWGGLGSSGKVERRFIEISGVVPPTPPNPPIPPSPTDPFTQTMLAAYSADTDSAKATRVAQLASVYRLGSSQVISDSTLVTSTDLWNRLKSNRQTLMPDDAIMKVRVAIETELNKTLSNPITFDSQSRATVASLLAKVASALELMK